MEVITITNQKGGVGKTTTAQVLATGLYHKGFTVLGIDLDPQQNFTFSAGFTPDEAETDIYTLFRGGSGVSLLQAVQTSPIGFDFVPGSLGLAGADMEFTKPGREYILKELLEPVKEKYDYCVIDTPSILGILTVNALTASNKVIVPMDTEIFSLRGLSQLQNLLTNTRKYCNPGLKLDGLLLTKYDPRAVINRSLKESLEQITKNLDTRIYKTCIRASVAIKEIQFSQTDIFTAYPKHNLTKDYQAFINEFLKG